MHKFKMLFSENKIAFCKFLSVSKDPYFFCTLFVLCLECFFFLALPKEIIRLEWNVTVTLPLWLRLLNAILSFSVLIFLCLFFRAIGGIIGFFFLLLLLGFSLFELGIYLVTGHYGDYVFLAIGASGVSSSYLYILCYLLPALLIISFVFRKKIPLFNLRLFLSCLITLIFCIFSQIVIFKYVTAPQLNKRAGGIGWIIAPTLGVPPWKGVLASPEKSRKDWPVINTSLSTGGFFSENSLFIRHSLPGLEGELLGWIMMQFDSGMSLPPENSKNFPEIFDSKSLEGLVTAKNIVVVMGESSNPKYWDIYGGEKGTTPLLKKYTEHAPLCLLSAAHANVNQTRFAVLSTFSDFSPINLRGVKEDLNLLELARRNNFKTFWFALQPENAGGAGDISILAHSTDYYQGPPMTSSPPAIMQMNNLNLGTEPDMLELPRLLNEALKSHPMDHKLIVLHGWGSHYPYISRYTEEDKKAFPKATDYALTIHHTDRFLNTVLQELRNTEEPSILFYTSDHGEVVGTGHGITGVEEGDYPIPILVAGLNGMDTDALCHQLEGLRNENGWYNSTMNHYFLGELLGYHVNAKAVAKDRKQDLYLSPENDYTSAFTWHKKLLN